MSLWRLVIVDALVLGALVSTTLVVFGLFRIPNAYGKLYANSAAVVLGALTILAAVVVVGDWSLITRAVLVALFLLLTTPVSAHVLARLETLQRCDDDV